MLGTTNIIFHHPLVFAVIRTVILLGTCLDRLPLLEPPLLRTYNMQKPGNWNRINEQAV